MTQKRETETERELDLMFQAARDHVQPPSDRLMQAILQDAAQVRPVRDVPVRGSAPGWFQRAVNGIGGWRSVTALAASICFGLWIGYTAPNVTDLLDSGQSLNGDTSIDFTFYSDIDDLLMEG